MMGNASLKETAVRRTDKAAAMLKAKDANSTQPDEPNSTQPSGKNSTQPDEPNSTQLVRHATPEQLAEQARSDRAYGPAPVVQPNPPRPGLPPRRPGDGLREQYDQDMAEYNRLGDILQGGYQQVRSVNADHSALKANIAESDAVNANRAPNAAALHGAEQEVLGAREALARDAELEMAVMKLEREDSAAEQEEKRADIEANISRYATAVDKETQEFARMEEFDPGAAWADKTAGQKIRIFLAGFGRGLLGLDPKEVMADVMDRELQAHRQNRSDAGERLDATRANRDNAQLRMSSFLALTNDQRVADKLVELTTLRGIDSKMASMEAGGAVTANNAQWAQTRDDVRQQVANTELAIRRAENNNPTHNSRTVDTLGKEARRMLHERQDLTMDNMKEGSKQLAGMQRDAAKTNQEGQDRLALQKDKHQTDLTKWVAEQTVDLRIELSRIEAFEKKYADDIPGIHALSRGTPEWFTNILQENRVAREELFRIIEIRLRRESGAVIGDPEIARAARATVDAMTEGDVREDLGRRRNEAAERVDFLTRGVPTEIEAAYTARPIGKRTALRKVGGSNTVDVGFEPDE